MELISFIIDSKLNSLTTTFSMYIVKQSLKNSLSIVDAHFCEPVSKNPYGGKPNEKQGPKACQEDQRAREVQRKKCKGKGFAVEYKFATEYKSAVEYSSLVEWLRQTKTNWA